MKCIFDFMLSNGIFNDAFFDGSCMNLTKEFLSLKVVDVVLMVFGCVFL